jgi:carboxylesterase type B
MPEERGKPQPRRKLSRRDFGRGALLTAAAAVPHANGVAKAKALTQSSSSQSTQLAPEAEAHFQAIIKKYGSRLSEDQRADIKRLIGQAQKTSDALRAFPLDNSDEPAAVFRIYRVDRTTEGKR